jgi:microsomal epoxide hydrolase
MVTVNFCIMPKPDSVSMESLTEAERTGVERGMAFGVTGNAYAKEQGNRPATIGLVLATNPLALLAW